MTASPNNKENLKFINLSLNNFELLLLHNYNSTLLVLSTVIMFLCCGFAIQFLIYGLFVAFVFSVNQFIFSIIIMILFIISYCYQDIIYLVLVRACNKNYDQFCLQIRGGSISKNDFLRRTQSNIISNIKKGLLLFIAIYYGFFITNFVIDQTNINVMFKEFNLSEVHKIYTYREYLKLQKIKKLILKELDSHIINNDSDNTQLELKENNNVIIKTQDTKLKNIYKNFNISHAAGVYKLQHTEYENLSCTIAYKLPIEESTYTIAFKISTEYIQKLKTFEKPLIAGGI